MLKKIETSDRGVWYDGTKLDLYVDYQDPTKFLFTDKSVTPLLSFTCDHTCIDDIQDKIEQVMPTVLQAWQQLHKTQDQRERISLLATDQNVNIIVNDVRKFDE